MGFPSEGVAEAKELLFSGPRILQVDRLEMFGTFLVCAKELFVLMHPFLFFYLKDLLLLFTSAFHFPLGQAAHSLKSSLVPTMHLTASGDAQERMDQRIT